jgi:hypothetical protein
VGEGPQVATENIVVMLQLISPPTDVLVFGITTLMSPGNDLYRHGD